MQRSRNHIAISRRNHLPYILFVLAEMWSDPDWFYCYLLVFFRSGYSGMERHAKIPFRCDVSKILVPFLTWVAADLLPSTCWDSWSPAIPVGMAERGQRTGWLKVIGDMLLEVRTVPVGVVTAESSLGETSNRKHFRLNVQRTDFTREAEIQRCSWLPTLPGSGLRWEATGKTGLCGRFCLLS